MTSTTSTSASLLLCLRVHSDAAEVCKQPMCNLLKYKTADTTESCVACHKCHMMHLNKPIAQHLHLKYLLTALSMLKMWTACLLMSATASKVKVWRFCRTACSSRTAELTASVRRAMCCCALVCTDCKPSSKETSFAACMQSATWLQLVAACATEVCLATFTDNASVIFCNTGPCMQ